MRRPFRVLRGALSLCVALLASSCGDEFGPGSRLSTVRILGIRSDTPYVRPGATFTTEVLAYDGRADRSRPMRLYWLEDICFSPTDGKPEDCYRQLEAKYPRNQDLTSRVTEGERNTFAMPADAITAAPQTSSPRLALVFAAACAGHLELVGSAEGYPSSVPFACVDQGRRLDANDFVFAFMRVYVSNDLTNANPMPSGVTLDGVPLPTDRPFSFPHCTVQNIDDCPARKLAVTIGNESQEIDPTSGAPGGALLKEQIWSSFFVSSGKLDSESLILFDARHGRTSKAEDEYRGPTVAGNVDLIVVTHDNRSGVAFQSFKLQAE
ncbi:hypothetical protein LZC95_49660 [Pendulispora brunnea]|uniref:Lipoprotein n=1 Tax=Pendulispora brunnea TaxID=2905690 RepID=A0ABZ2K738_9BACT